jgi:hypothetical protein
MHIYKFRILLEDNDQFFREIDVKANQTFEDLHTVLIDSAGFTNEEMASFYICDSKWNKLQEISLCEMMAPEEEDIDDDEPEPSKKQAKPILCMKDSRLKDVIIDPHQRIIYVYDFLKMHTFYIELFKILAADPGKKYPLVVKSTGRAIQSPPLISDDSDENDDEDILLKEFNSNEDDAETAGGDEMMEGFYDDTTFN